MTESGQSLRRITRSLIQFLISWKGLILAAVVLFLAYSILNTRLGVHLVLDVFTELGEEEEVIRPASQGPLKISAVLTPVETIPLPEGIEQPSGIKHRNRKVYISTDQVELFVLGVDFKETKSSTVLRKGPLLFKQGILEGIEVQEGRLIGVGELGEIPVWVKDSYGGWLEVAPLSVSHPVKALEFTGIAQTPDGLVATVEGSLELLALKTATPIQLSFGSFVKEDGDLLGLAFSGIAYHDGAYFLLTEQYTSVLVFGAKSAALQYVFEVEPSAAADLSYYDGKIYVVIDHNYNEPRPDVQVYDIEAAMAELDSES
ncbi:MAG: hypothetical protein AAGJ81_13570 [Verrucomicrobiota bacterium]